MKRQRFTVTALITPCFGQVRGISHRSHRLVHRLSQRRASQALAVDRSSIRYRNQPPDDGHGRLWPRGVAAIRRRFGYRRLHVLLQCEARRQSVEWMNNAGE
jgi:hypothetical protein